MGILWWLVPTVVATLAACCWVGWRGRGTPDRLGSEVDAERFAAAILKPLPGGADLPRTLPREPSTGVAVRRRAG